MNQTPTPKVHKDCNKVMKAIICTSNPKAGEWYCATCHKSELMDAPGEHSFWASVHKG